MLADGVCVVWCIQLCLLMVCVLADGLCVTECTVVLADGLCVS